MNLSKNINYIGKVAIEGSPFREIDIVLSFSDKGVFFEFYGNFTPDVSYGILTGILLGNGEFTLINSFQQSYKNGLYRFKADYLIYGLKFKTRESLVFNRYRFILRDLSNWLNMRFWKTNFPKVIEMEESLYNQVVNIEAGVNLRISNNFEYKDDFTNYSLELKGYSFIEVISINKEKGFSFDYTFSFYVNFLKLLSLVSARRYSIGEIFCIIDKPRSSNEKLIFDSFPVYRELNEIENSSIFSEIKFKFDEINEYLEPLFIEWNKREELKHLIDLNLTFCLNADNSRNSHFLNAFACLEGIDKHLNGMKDKARQRLNRYKSYIEEIYPKTSDVFIDNCLNTRNFFAHGKKNNTEYIFNNFELLYAAKTLINISRVLLLKELGIPENLLNDKFKAIATDLKDYMRSNKWFNEGLIEIPLI